MGGTEDREPGSAGRWWHFRLELRLENFEGELLDQQKRRRVNPRARPPGVGEGKLDWI